MLSFARSSPSPVFPGRAGRSRNGKPFRYLAVSELADEVDEKRRSRGGAGILLPRHAFAMVGPGAGLRALIVSDRRKCRRPEIDIFNPGS